MTLAEVLAKMPTQLYLKCRVEVDPDDGRHYLSAVIMEKAPEGGWSSLAEYFGSPGRREDPGILEGLKYDDSCLVGVSASIDDPESFDRLVVNMIHQRWPRIS